MHSIVRNSGFTPNEVISSYSSHTHTHTIEALNELKLCLNTSLSIAYKVNKSNLGYTLLLVMTLHYGDNYSINTCHFEQ